MDHHFLDELRATFADRAQSPALVYRGRSYSYGELDRLIRRGAAWLQRLGMAAGDRVAPATPQKSPFLLAHLSVLFGGGTPLPLNPRWRDVIRTAEFVLKSSEAADPALGQDRDQLRQRLALMRELLRQAQGQPPAAERARRGP